jgi:hypothetical protein
VRTRVALSARSIGRRLAPWAPALLAACSCGAETAPAPPAEPTLPFLFHDVTEESGLAGFHQVNGSLEKNFVVEYTGGGVGLFDPDQDGDLDAYLTNGSLLEGLEPGKEPRDAFYENDGRGHFTDATAAAGLGDANWTNGVRAVDLDGDGWTEMYLTNYGPDVLYRNRGDGTFADVTAEAGVADSRWSTGASFLDFDKDGDLDLYVANYILFEEERMLRERPVGTMNGHSSVSEKSFVDVRVMFGPQGMPGDRDCFYVQEEPWRFRDASVETGVDAEDKMGFQTVAYDIDLDGWVDVYVANDVFQNLLWHNEHGERFVDQALVSGAALSGGGKPQGSMGVAVGDYDGDLLPDLYVTNFTEDYNTLYRGRPGGNFLDVTARVGLVDPVWMMVAWGAGFVDFDSDGDQELFAVNGHVYPQVDQFDIGTTYRQPAQLFALEGARYAVPAGAGGPGFEPARACRGAAWGDVDGDGDMDLLFGNIDGPPTLLRNDGPSQRWVKVLVLGKGANREAVGARIVVRVGERRDLRCISTSGSFLSSYDPREHFGLGPAEKADELEVTWPDGRVERFTDLAAGKLYTVLESESGPSTLSATELVPQR